MVGQRGVGIESRRRTRLAPRTRKGPPDAAAAAEKVPDERTARLIRQGEQGYHGRLEAVTEATRRPLAALGGVGHARVEGAWVERECVLLHDDDLIRACAQDADLLAAAGKGDLGRSGGGAAHVEAERWVEAARVEQVEVVDGVLKEFAQGRPEARPR